MVYQDENNVVLDEKSVERNHVQIEKVRALISLFSYIVVNIST